MTKLKDAKNDIEYNAMINYAEQTWIHYRGLRTSALSRITGYLFILNSGALLASLTYIATKTNTNELVHLSIKLFSAGTVFSVIHATLDYYAIENLFATYRKDVDEFYESKIGWDVFKDRIDKNDYKVIDVFLHIIGWLGALSFVIGLFVGINQL